MRRVVVVVFEGAQTLDAVGPAEVFAAAGAAYRVELASVGGGLVRTTSALVLETRDLRRMRPRPDDVVVVAGGEEAAIRAALADAALLRWLRGAARVVHRLTSVCSGAFVLAAAGLLDGRRATTHWAATRRLAALFPRVTVDPGAIFVKDGRVVTSAGVTTGIDMALSLVEEELGRAAADAIAARLVLYLRRPGFQSQFSEALVAQTEASDPLGATIAWARGRLDRLDVPALADHAGLSVRTLHRRCLEHVGTTPAKLIEKLRVEHARTLLATSALAVKGVAARCGFGGPARMRRAFERELGVRPAAYRLLHARRGRGRRRSAPRGPS